MRELPFVAVPFVAVLLGAFLSLSPVRGQAFDCILLNDDNTNLFVPPDACFMEPLAGKWCDCVRSAFTNPVRGEVSGFQQAVVWVIGEPGIGNHRVEVPAGTLDLGGLKAGDVLGEVIADELIPGSFPFVGGEFFTVKIEIRVTAAGPGAVDFDVNVTSTTAGVRLALGYDPTEERHAFGHTYSGRLAALGPGKGFTLEYRYAREEIRDDPERRPGLDVNEAGSPTFTIPLLFNFFSAASGIYTLPDAPSVGARTTLRRFTDTTLDEIVELAAADLCEVIADQDPCKVFDESFDLPAAQPPNRRPTAEINMLDGLALTVLPDPVELQTYCGRARVLLRGRNSRDGDGDIQPLGYAWFVKQGPQGAAIPAHTVDFKDTQVFFSRAGEYEISLRVDDGGAENATDEASVHVNVRSDFDSNVPPTAVISSTPDPPEVRIEGGLAAVTLDGTGSSNGFQGEDDCSQELTYLWRQIGGPAGAEIRIADPTEESTRVELQAPGLYAIELEVDDGSQENSTDSAVINVMVLGESPEPLFRRGDSDGDGKLSLTDAVRALNWLFLGAAAPTCLDAADTDDSGVVNISDPIQVLQFLFLGGGAPAPPGPEECGRDGGVDGLETCRYEKC